LGSGENSLAGKLMAEAAKKLEEWLQSETAGDTVVELAAGASDGEFAIFPFLENHSPGISNPDPYHAMARGLWLELTPAFNNRLGTPLSVQIASRCEENPLNHAVVNPRAVVNPLGEGHCSLSTRYSSWILLHIPLTEGIETITFCSYRFAQIFEPACYGWKDVISSSSSTQYSLTYRCGCPARV